MIYVTHDQVEAMTMGDRIVVMKDGLIQQVDQPIALYDNPKNMFVAGFIGSPAMNFFKGSIEQRQGALWFVEQNAGANTQKGFGLRINDDMAKKLNGYIGKTITFGSRPEDINNKQYATFTQPNQTVPATVEVVEPMGAEIYLYLNTGSHSFVARVNSHEKAEVGQRLDMAFDMRKCHFFDMQTEQVVA
jgi:multiple sugar transport system ATP-binding protein